MPFPIQEDAQGIGLAENEGRLTPKYLRPLQLQQVHNSVSQTFLVVAAKDDFQLASRGNLFEQ
ncbi:hypothetical protein [Anatilimnocola aggregata]|uniref:hypothetical protein n=1 Tax=Anatilimnocola aggregata TaxID=2528021 RepID=UPI00192E32A9|nr:hypothetical protein [Anatilimnocola aggregata]